MDLVAHTVRVDHQSGVLPSTPARLVDLTGRLVYVNIADPARPSRAIAGEFAVDVKRISKAAPMHDLAVFLFAHRPRRPARALGDRMDEIDGALVLQVTQAIFDRVDAGLCRGLVDIGFMRKGVRQRRNAAKP